MGFTLSTISCGTRPIRIMRPITGAMAIAVVTAVVGAVPMRLGVGVAVAVVTARGVEMVRLREERRRNDDKD